MSIDNLPSWPGASVVYSRCMAINEAICRDAYAVHCAGRNRKGKWAPPPDVAAAIDAMNRGDEEACKAWVAANLSIIFPPGENNA